MHQPGKLTHLFLTKLLDQSLRQRKQLLMCPLIARTSFLRKLKVHLAAVRFRTDPLQHAAILKSIQNRIHLRLQNSELRTQIRCRDALLPISMQHAAYH